MELPPIQTPDIRIQCLVKTFGVEALANERHYWGIELGGETLILVAEADGSRRLLRDCEARARSQLTWGYGGTGPYNLSEVLVDDVLGPLVHCPSCFGAIAVAGDAVDCPCCNGTGYRQELFDLRSACGGITSTLSKEVRPELASDTAPPCAQWHLVRSELLQRLIEMMDTDRECPDQA